MFTREVVVDHAETTSSPFAALRVCPISGKQVSTIQFETPLQGSLSVERMCQLGQKREEIYANDYRDMEDLGCRDRRIHREVIQPAPPAFSARIPIAGGVRDAS